MSLTTIGVSIALDGEAEYKQALKAINAEQKELRTEMELSAASHKENANSLEALQEKYDILTKNIAAQKDRVEVYETAIKNYGETQKEASQNVEYYAKSLELLRGDLKELEESGEASNDKIKEQKERISEAEDQLKRAELAYADCGSKIADYQSKLNAANTQLVIWDEELQRTDVFLKEAKGSIDHCATSIDNVGKEVEETGKEGEKTGSIFKNTTFSVDIINAADKLAEITKKTGKEFYELATQAAFAADEINTLSVNTGVATDTIQALKYSEELLDTSLETVTSSMAKNIRSMNSAREGSEAYANAYNKLGISVTDANGDLRDSEEVFWEVIDALGKVENATEKDAISMQLFGRNAQSLNSLIAAGSKGFQEMYQEAYDLGYIMDKETIASLTRTSDAIERVSKTADAFKNKIGAEVAPLVEEAANDISRLMMEHSDEAVELVETVIPALVEGLEFVVDNIDIIAPIVEGVAVGFAALKVQMAAAEAETIVYTIANSMLPPELMAAAEAQGIFNAAVAANPVGAVAAVIGLTVTAISAYTISVEKSTSKVAELTGEQKKFVDSANASIRVIEDSRASFEDNAATMAANETQSQRLITRLKELDPVAKSDSEKMDEMQTVVDQLNTLMPELGLSINSVTGELNMSTEAVERYSEAFWEKLQFEANQERIVELYKQQTEIESELIKGEDAYNEALAKREEALEAYRQANDEYNAALEAGDDATWLRWAREEALETSQVVIEETSEITRAHADLQNSYESTTEELERLKGVVSDTSAEETATAALEEMSQKEVEWRGYVIQATGDADAKLEELSEAYYQAKQAAAESLQSQMGLFQEFTVESHSLDEMTKNTQAQADTLTNYGDNLQKALDLEIDPQIIADIEEMGLSGAGYLDELVRAAEAAKEGLPGAAEEYQNFIDAWNDYQQALEETSSKMGEFETIMAETGGQIVLDLEDNQAAMLEDQGTFSEIYVQSWTDMGNDAAQAIADAEPLIMENTAMIADTAINTLNTELGITGDRSSKGYDAGNTFMKSVGQAILDMEDELVDDVASVGRKMVEEAKEWSRRVNEALGEDL